MQVPVYTYRAIPGGFQILADGVLCHHQPFQAGVPGFQPYPWGARDYIKTMVRNILLAEPLVDEFARCFAGVTPDEAAELAGCFAFDRCDRRAELIGALREHLAS